MNRYKPNGIVIESADIKAIPVLNIRDEPINIIIVTKATAVRISRELRFVILSNCCPMVSYSLREISAILVMSLFCFMVAAPDTPNSKEISLSLGSSRTESSEIIVGLFLPTMASLLILSSSVPTLGRVRTFKAKCNSAELNLEIKSSNVMLS